MKLPPDVEFREEIRLFVHRPRGLLNEAVVHRLIAALSFGVLKPGGILCFAGALSHPERSPWCSVN